MDESINPYGAPAPATDSDQQADLTVPVTFSGVWQSEDYLVALRSLDPSLVLQAITGVLAVPMFVAMVVIALRDTFPLENLVDFPPFVWFLITSMVTPLCWALWVIYGKHARLQRLRARKRGDAEQDFVKFGWVDEQGVFVCSATSAYRAQWELFSQPFLFRSHTVLPISFNASQRLVIPHRLFSSPSDCQAMRFFVHEKWGMQKSNRPKRDDLKKVSFARTDPSFRVTVAKPDLLSDSTQRWDDSMWPLQEQPSESQAFRIVDDVGPAVKSRWAVLAGLAVFLGPLYVMLTLWLAWDRSRFGDWSFLVWRSGENLWMQFPVLSLTIGALWMLWGQMRMTKQAAKETIELRITDVGIHFKRPSLDTWNGWSEIVKPIIESDRAGWVVKPLEDEVIYSKEAFRSNGEFEQFKAIMLKHTMIKQTEPSNVQQD